jgi:predicted nucleic acid-binding protein
LLANPQQVLVYVGLDRGEAEVLALASEQTARLVIIDERKGRRYARRLGLPLTGTLGVLLAAKDKGLVPALAPLIDQLLKEGLYFAPELVDKALEIAGEP